MLSLGIGGLAAAENDGDKARNVEKLRQEFLSWKFGMFLHFNMATFANVEWANGKEDPAIFKPDELDCGQWADAAKNAGMKYAILTVKHTGGWCLWPSDYTNHDITQFKNYKNGKGDIVKEFCEAFRKRGLKVGFYYCMPLWGKEWPKFKTLPIEGFEDGSADALTFVKNQFKELLTKYGDISVLWVDQAESPHGGLKQGDWAKIKKYVNTIAPNCLVVNNNSKDFKTTDICGYEFPYNQVLPPGHNQKASEVCDRIQGGWFSRAKGSPPIREVDYLLLLLSQTNNNANVLLNCGPDGRGLLPDSVVKRLTEVGKIWKEKINGGKK
jgi:alpha-L-fucosidase